MHVESCKAVTLISHYNIIYTYTYIYIYTVGDLGPASDIFFQASTWCIAMWCCRSWMRWPPEMPWWALCWTPSSQVTGVTVVTVGQVSRGGHRWPSWETNHGFNGLGFPESWGTSSYHPAIFDWDFPWKPSSYCGTRILGNLHIPTIMWNLPGIDWIFRLGGWSHLVIGRCLQERVERDKPVQRLINHGY